MDIARLQYFVLESLNVSYAGLSPSNFILFCYPHGSGATAPWASKMSNDGWYSGPQGRSEFSSGSIGAIQRNRDGVPTWNGESMLFEEYVEACLLYEQTVVREKRYLCGPRLASELQGPARRVLIGRPANWLSHEGGVRKLVNALRQERGQPKVPELSELLQKYFRGTRRARGEAMGDFILRKAEAYTRAQQSMARYMKEQGIKNKPSTLSTGTDAWSGAGGRHSNLEDSANGDTEAIEDPTEPDDAEAEDHEPDEETATWSYWDDPWASGWSQWSGYGGYSDWEWWWPETLHTEISDTSEWSREQLPEILPDFVQGWLLFMDAGLDVMERNVLHAELKGTFGVREVEEVLRKHWSDPDLKKRDAEKGRYAANMGVEITEEDISCFGEPEASDLEAEGFSAEEIQIWMAEEDQVQRALALMHDAKRTLRDARARQHAVRTSRQFYPNRSHSTGGGQRDGGLWKQLQKPKAGIRCFRCGGPRKVAECKAAERKEKPKENSQSNVATEEAPLVFLATKELAERDEFLALHANDEKIGNAAWLSTDGVVSQGKAVLDGGATRTIGSIAALEQVASLNAEKRGTTGVSKIDFEDRPVFGFGNSSRNQCASTAELSVPLGGRNGTLKVHALDQGSAPILLSVHSLRALGAVIDFEHDLAVFRKADASRMIPLERSAAGHQVMPLTEDAYEHAIRLREPLKSLKDLE